MSEYTFQPGAALLALLFSLTTLSIATFRGFFVFRAPYQKIALPFWRVLLAFVIYVGGTLLVYAILRQIFPLLPLALFHLLYLIIILAILALYLVSMRPALREQVIGGALVKRGVCMGLLAWVICYPVVLLTNQIAMLVSHTLWPHEQIDQNAVIFVKQALEHPVQLVAMLFTTVLLAPIVEEILFRGFLQTWLRKWLSRWGAIIVGGVLFALVHYSPMQGPSNFDILISLFVLSLFLGFIYERERTLWASITLHALFNGVSACAIFFQK